ncbi:glycogen synthase [Pseudocnuella soli]|uniref:glycogen synthase n=1 Tax=Pseudocnuella soli TaxID=2502779 RepID=UPI0010467611|nr:glycogen synthase [Pseudocnuella soli]
MEIIHVSAECYPVAKAGGLGDVVGALPKYQNLLGHSAKVVMPMYRTKFLFDNDWELVHEGGQYLGSQWFHYSIIREQTNKLGFDLYLVDINGLLDREKVYGYADDLERFLSFQLAVCDWLVQWQHQPDIIHCHDHHTGLIPFFIKHTYAFNRLAGVPSIFTIHNAEYQGWIGWDKAHLLPHYDDWKTGMLEWGGTINSLASAVKCAWKVNTVSPSYMEELRYGANGLEALFEYERGKCTGILNGIDNEVWDPATDPLLHKNFDAETAKEGKRKNKKELCQRFGLDPDKPLIVFIGRLVGEKAADLLPDAIRNAIYQQQTGASYLILGSGEPQVEVRLNYLRDQFGGFVNTFIGYNEALAHQMYAGADFLLMPSRVEPCGLNQLYALRYGTVPMVRSTGGLRDTVKDFGDWQGFGIRFDRASVDDIVYSLGRAQDLYYNKPDLFGWMRSYMMQIDHSWETSAITYINLYESTLVYQPNQPSTDI